MSYMLCVVSIIFKLEGYPAFACFTLQDGGGKKSERSEKNEVLTKAYCFY